MGAGSGGDGDRVDFVRGAGHGRREEQQAEGCRSLLHRDQREPQQAAGVRPLQRWDAQAGALRGDRRARRAPGAADQRHGPATGVHRQRGRMSVARQPGCDRAHTEREAPVRGERGQQHGQLVQGDEPRSSAGQPDQLRRDVPGQPRRPRQPALRAELEQPQHPGHAIHFGWSDERDQRRVAAAQPRRDHSRRAARHRLR